MNSKTLAILTYIDDTPSMVEEFDWLYKSWIYSGNWRTSDIVAVCNPSVIAKLPQDSNIIYIPKEPVSHQSGSRWAGYHYINSIHCVVGEHTAHLAQKYTHILRTDADVFLAPALADLRPNFYVFGRGRYIQTAETRQIITDFATRHGLTHNGVFNVGSTMLGPSAGVLAFVAEQGRLCEILLDDFGDNQGEWPRWWRGTMTMYAGELAANHHYFQYLYGAYLNMLDYESYFAETKVLESRIAHIHAFHNSDYWSKFVHREGGYKDMPVEKIDITTVAGYSHWLAVTPVETIKQLSHYPL